MTFISTLKAHFTLKTAISHLIGGCDKGKKNKKTYPKFRKSEKIKKIPLIFKKNFRVSISGAAGENYGRIMRGDHI